MKDTRGFSLVELVVVMGIIALLAAITLASIASVRAKSRDAKRVSEVAQMQLKVELYYEACRQYPATLTTSANNGCPSGTTLGSFLNPIPVYPTPPASVDYLYAVNTARTAYVMGAQLEKASSLPSSDVDAAPSGVTATCTDSPNPIYCVTN